MVVHVLRMRLETPEPPRMSSRACRVGSVKRPTVACSSNHVRSGSAAKPPASVRYLRSRPAKKVLCPATGNECEGGAARRERRMRAGGCLAVTGSGASQVRHMLSNIVGSGSAAPEGARAAAKRAQGGMLVERGANVVPYANSERNPCPVHPSHASSVRVPRASWVVAGSHQYMLRVVAVIQRHGSGRKRPIRFNGNLNGTGELVVVVARPSSRRAQRGHSDSAAAVQRHENNGDGE